MEELLMNVNWTAVVVGAVLAFVLGWLWYSPKLFGSAWAKGSGINMDSEKKSKMEAAPMVAQAAGTFLMAWVIGITATTDSLTLAILITLTIATLIKASGLFAMKSKMAVTIDAGFVLAMAAVMIAVHALI